MVTALQNITDVVHDVRTNRNFSRRVKDGRIEEFHQFGEDFNSLLDEMEEWQLKLQAKNAQLLRTAMHDPLTGLANRAAFRSSIAALMHDASAKPTLPCSSSTVIISSLLTIPGHAAGDCVLIEVARRMVEFGDKRHQSYRLGGDEFAMVLYGVQSAAEVQQICAALSQQFMRPFDLHNGQTATMSF